MYSHPKGDTTKPKYAKLRASCDTCFLAKVKCSKSRPICSRCLACGADCRYSPSSRLGKPKASESSHRRSSSIRNHGMHDGSAPAQYLTPSSMSIDIGIANAHGLGSGWSSALNTPDDSAKAYNMWSSAAPRTGLDEGSMGQDNLDAVLSLAGSPQTGIASPCMDGFQVHQRSKSYPDQSAQQSLAPWYDTPGPYYSASAPSVSSGHNIYMYNNTQDSYSDNSTCDCFNTCLSALQALHNSDAITDTSPFDIILTINQHAVESCSTMLSCPLCTSQSGSSMRTMLLGTIFGRIISIYQDASKHYFTLTSAHGGQNQQLPLTLGTYRIAGEDVRWLQMEIILRDLKKLKELFARFQETSMMSETEGDAGMHGAVSTYLSQSLSSTFESLEKQRGYSERLLV